MINDNYTKQLNYFGIKNSPPTLVRNLSNRKIRTVNKNEIERNLNVIEDKAQDCNAYLKIKHFLANQVIEMETKMEEKDSFIMGATIKINNLTHIIEKFKNKFCLMNKKINKLREKNRYIKLLFKRSIECSDKSFTSDKNSKSFFDQKIRSESILTGNMSLDHYTISCYSIDELEKNEENIKHPKKQNISENNLIKNDEDPDNFNAKLVEENEILKKKIQDVLIDYKNRCEILNKEKVTLTQRNSYLNAEIKMKNSIIDRLENQNTFILNELIELVNSLRTIDIRILNKIYLHNLSIEKKEDLETLEIPSCLGIKYNIFSAESFLSYIINSNKQNSNNTNYNYIKQIDNFLDNDKKINRKIDPKVYFHENNREYHVDLKANTNQKQNPKKSLDKVNKIKKIQHIKMSELKVNKNFYEDSKNINQKDKIDLNDNNVYDHSSHIAFFNLEKSDSFSGDNSFEKYLNENYYTDFNHLNLYSSKDYEKEVYLNDYRANNKLTDKIINLSKYKEQLNYLLEKNMKKSKLLNYSDSE